MDDVARSTSRRDSDLAAIVLGRTQPIDRHIDAPERVPAWVDHAPARGFDARSVAVLALVVAVLAAVAGWATSIGDEPAAPATKPKERTSNGSASATVSAPVKEPAAVPATVKGLDLTPARLVASRSGSGSGLVTVSIKNAGTGAASGTTDVLVLVDGQVIGSGEFGSLAPGASTRVEVPLDWCPSERVAVVAVVDPSSTAREGDERNNSISRSTTFGC